MTRNMFDHAGNTAGCEPFQSRARETCDRFGISAKSPVANYVMCARNRQIDDRRTICMNRQGSEFCGDEPVAEPGSGKSPLTIIGKNIGIVLTTRKKRPFRRLQPCHTSTLLIDKDQARPIHRVPDVIDEASDLGPRYAGAAHQDDPPGLLGGEQCRFLLREHRPRNAEDASLDHYPVTTMQLSPPAFTASQNFDASDRSAKLPTRNR
jgi:hypothetical protein